MIKNRQNNHRVLNSVNRLFLLLLTIALFTACSGQEDEKVVLSSEAYIENFSFKNQFNSDLDEDIKARVRGTKIEVSVPYKVSIEELIPSFTFVGAKIEVNNVEQQSDVTKINFDQTVIYRVTAENGDVTEYTVTVTKNPPRIPRVYINTENNFEFQDKDKEKYVKSTVRIEDPDNYYSTVTDFTGNGEIKGRGNSTWTAPKRPYRIKLNDKARLLGMSNDKNWALLANYFDKTLLRNITAFELSRIADMNWTPKSLSVDYYMNDTYRGVYTLTEHVRVSDERLDFDLVSDDEVVGDYLLELDFHYDEPSKFKTNMKQLPILFKDPDMPNSAQFNYVKDFFNTAESVLYSSNFKDPVNGYRKYLDVESFIKYYIVHEIAKNVDGNFRGSCHMALRENGKIELPMIWDFDIAFGNADHITWEQEASSREWDGWYIKTQSPWFDQLFKDPAFVAEVKTMWNELKPQLDEVPEYVRAQAKLINEAQIRNFSPKPQGAGWSVTERTWNTSFVRGSYQAELNYLVYFIEKRIEWLHTNINNLD